MKITRNRLKSIVTEEVSRALTEISPGDGQLDSDEADLLQKLSADAIEDAQEDDEPRDYKHGSPEDPLYHPESSEEWVTLTASDGEEIRLPSTMSGLETGFAVIANPAEYGDDHPFYSPYWKHKDGDTVIGVEEDYAGGPGETMSVADAYQELHRMFDEEHAAWAKDIEDERRDQMQADLDDANIAAAVAAAEEERMQTPEEGEELPRQIGMGRGRTVAESFTRNQLRRIIHEELSRSLNEDVDDARMTLSSNDGGTAYMVISDVGDNQVLIRFGESPSAKSYTLRISQEEALQLGSTISAVASETVEGEAPEEQSSETAAIASEINNIPMYRGTRFGDPESQPTGLAYFISSEVYAKTYGPTAAWTLDIKNPKIVDRHTWVDTYAHDFRGELDQSALGELAQEGHDSVATVMDTPAGKMYTVLVLRADQVVSAAR